MPLAVTALGAQPLASRSAAVRRGRREDEQSYQTEMDSKRIGMHRFLDPSLQGSLWPSRATDEPHQLDLLFIEEEVDGRRGRAYNDAHEVRRRQRRQH